VDPKFVKPAPDNGVKYTIRELPVPVPCRWRFAGGRM